MSVDLPPLAAIRVFEAAAKYENFTRASEALGMTQAAVSYQIRVLEDRIGEKLFLRRARGVVLTELGRQLFRRTTSALDQLRDAFAEARTTGQETLVINVIPTFASNFLAARLGLFQIDHPDIAVRVEVSQDLIDFETSDADLAIRQGQGNWPGLKCVRLFDAEMTPMLSPALAETIGGVDTPADLLKLPLLDPSDPWWPAWFARAGVPFEPLPVTEANVRFDAEVLEANAAIAGHGVGRLTPALHRDALKGGRLLHPFDLTHGSGDAFWLVSPHDRRNTTKIRTFRAWMEDQVAASR
ncbi:MAG: LysR substrate-binding domain-containing protein [Pseudomonadota bacterium]